MCSAADTDWLAGINGWRLSLSLRITRRSKVRERSPKGGNTPVVIPCVVRGLRTTAGLSCSPPGERRWTSRARFWWLLYPGSYRAVTGEMHKVGRRLHPVCELREQLFHGRRRPHERRTGRRTALTPWLATVSGLRSRCSPGRPISTVGRCPLKPHKWAGMTGTPMSGRFTSASIASTGMKTEQFGSPVGPDFARSRTAGVLPAVVTAPSLTKNLQQDDARDFQVKTRSRRMPRGNQPTARWQALAALQGDAVSTSAPRTAVRCRPETSFPAGSLLRTPRRRVKQLARRLAGAALRLKRAGHR